MDNRSIEERVEFLEGEIGELYKKIDYLNWGIGIVSGLAILALIILFK